MLDTVPVTALSSIDEMAIAELRKRIGYIERDLPAAKERFKKDPIESVKWHLDEVPLMYFKIQSYRQAIDSIVDRGTEKTIKQMTIALIRLTRDSLKATRAQQLESVAIAHCLEYLIEIREYADSESEPVIGSPVNGNEPKAIAPVAISAVGEAAPQASDDTPRARSFPDEKYTVKRCNEEAKRKGLEVTVRAITRKDPWKNYTSGYLITDRHGDSRRWNDLASLHMNCIEMGRAIDGFARW